MSERGQRTQMAGTYRVYNEKLGKGAFATVYKGRCSITGTDVAVKVIDMKKLSSDKAKYVRDEVRHMKGLKHPNVVELLETQHNERHMLLIMELCVGGDLQTCIARYKSLSEVVCQHLFRQLIQGVDFLTSQGKMHRDLKSANLLLTMSDPTVSVLKIADFGLVKEAAENMNDTICGTPLYMAPERMKSGYGFPSDIFSCGIILFEMLIGRTPFGGTCMEEIQAASAKGLRQALPEGHSLSWTVVDLLEQLLRADPEKRPTPREVLRHAWLVAPPPPPVAHPQKVLSVVTTPSPSPGSSPPDELAGFADRLRDDFDRWVEYADHVLYAAREETMGSSAATLFVYAMRCGVAASGIWLRLPHTLSPTERQCLHSKLLDIQRRCVGGFEARGFGGNREIMVEVEVAAAQQVLMTYAVHVAQDGAVEESLCNAWSTDKAAVTAASLYGRARVVLKGLVELDRKVSSSDKETCKGFLGQLERRCAATDLSRPPVHR